MYTEWVIADSEKCIFVTNQKDSIARGKIFRINGREVKHRMYPTKFGTEFILRSKA